MRTTLINRPFSLSATTCAGVFRAAFIITGTSAAAQSLQCGSTYAIQSRDSLSKTAAQVYDAATLQIILGAIAHVIGIIPVGLRQIRVAQGANFFAIHRSEVLQSGGTGPH